MNGIYNTLYVAFCESAVCIPSVDRQVSMKTAAPI